MREGSKRRYLVGLVKGGHDAKPLLLWLGGGQGCSSVGFGEAQELGPFLVTNGPDGLALRFNNFTWNGDARAFLLNWLRRFPQYRMSDVYRAGDGYAGHLAQQFAEAIYNGNQNATPDTFINLKGMIVGNPNMNVETDFMGMIDCAWGHALNSDDLHSLIEIKCDFSNRYLIKDCSILLDEYNKLYDPSLMKHAMAYFSFTDVQYALHANVARIPQPWRLCSVEVRLSWSDSPSSVLPILKKLIDGGIRLWIYSGDTDGRIPVTSTRYTLNKLGLNITENWTPWYDGREVGGWTITYEGLTFLTVRGAGHQVPTFALERSLRIIRAFLADSKLPSTPF
ncbi:hypothetical protein ACJRO7_020055 [Eucalyptus globulus]|uniref:Uncharacterized protein n=1 Tax=Eucalyptus globulus TaxID=34317 RepID=A0ABD3KJZ3_EUCGL